MKITIDTDDFNSEGVAQVMQAIKAVQARYPTATEEEIIWGMAHCTAALTIEDPESDPFIADYLPSLAEANGWAPNDQGKRTP